MPSHRIEMIGICSQEQRELLSKELIDIGCSNISLAYKAVYFSVPSYSVFYKLHLCSRIASKFLLIIKKARLSEKLDITEACSSIKWSNLFDPKCTFLVEGVPADRNEGLSANAISKAVRLAIEAGFKNSKQIPKVDLKNPNLKFVAWLSKTNLIVSVDTCLNSLHKRGYRSSTHHPSTLKETIASFVLQTLNYDGSTPLFDPFMGTGTFLIEAGYIQQHHYPMLYRKNSDFGFSYLKFFNPKLFEKIKKDLKKIDLNKSNLEENQIYGSDIDPRCVKEAKENLSRSHLNLKNISVKVEDFFNYLPSSKPGLLVSNLPYGQRLKSQTKVDELFYKKIGDKLKKDYEGWKVAFIVGQDTPYKMIGLRPSMKLAFTNGGLDVKLLVFEMYKGSKKLSSKSLKNS